MTKDEIIRKLRTKVAHLQAANRQLEHRLGKAVEVIRNQQRMAAA